MNEPIIVVICGPSGSGKNTLIELLLKDPGYSFSKIITCTSRPSSRAGESSGKDYYFLSEEEFKKRIKQNYFLEYEHTHGHLYGTPKDSFNKPGLYLAHLDIRGGLSVKKVHHKTLIVFINTPLAQIISRLYKRGETKKAISARIETAKREFESSTQADIVINNYDGKLDKAYGDLKMAIDKFLSIK